jgi:hypothetical protein
MTIHHFKNLDSKSKFNYLSQYGVFLKLSLFYNNVEVILYSFKSFYVEVLVTPYHEILNIRCFANMQRLDKYLQQVDITEIENLLHTP